MLELRPPPQAWAEGCWETKQSSPEGGPCQHAVPEGWLGLAEVRQAKCFGLYVLGTLAGKSPFNKALLKPFAFQQFAYMNLEISPS